MTQEKPRWVILHTFIEHSQDKDGGKPLFEPVLFRISSSTSVAVMRCMSQPGKDLGLSRVVIGSTTFYSPLSPGEIARIIDP